MSPARGTPLPVVPMLKHMPDGTWVPGHAVLLPTPGRPTPRALWFHDKARACRVRDRIVRRRTRNT